MNRKRRAFITAFYDKNRTAFVVAMLSSLMTVTINLRIAWIMQQIIDRVSGVSGTLTLPVLACHVAAVVTAIAALKTVSYFSRPRFMETAMRQYKDRAFRRLTRKSPAAFRAENIAGYISAFSNDATAIESGYLDIQFSLLANVLILLGALIMMIAYSPPMTVVACAFFLLPIGVSYATGHRVEDAERRISERNSALISALQDGLRGFAVVMSFKAETAMCSLFAQRNAAVEQAKCRKRKLTTVISAMAGVAGVTAQLGTFLVGAFLAAAGWGITPGILVVFINLTSYVLNPVSELPAQLASHKAAVALIDKLADSLENPIREEGRRCPDRLTHGIVCRDVSFEYEDGCPVLHHIHFTFVAGKKYAIVGASGSGKSTLLHLLMANHETYTGEIAYDENELKTIRSDALYDLVSIIEQNVFIFNASIRDNITMFHTFPQAAVDRAIELAGLSPLTAARGEDYRCGENGNGLSGGEKQRIAIARSLLKKSHVLLVDEATSALDAETADQVSRAVLGLADMTCLVVTHALNAAMLRQYDAILTLKNGAIVETGTFEELLAAKGYFYSLFTLAQ